MTAIPPSRSGQDRSTYQQWAIYRLPRQGVSPHPSEVHLLPLDQTRLLFLSAVEIRLLDPCPDDWFTGDIGDLLGRAVEI